MAKRQISAEDVMGVAVRQLSTSFLYKQPRLSTLGKYRKLYNTQVERKLRQQFNVPLPVFAGMVDTLQADLDDQLLIEFQNKDPADWKAVEKANAALKQESESVRPGAQWDEKFRTYRFEKILTGRGILAFTASSEDGYQSTLENVMFEDFHFEPTGGGDLENHIFCGRENVWKTASQLRRSAKAGIYDKKQVEKLIATGGRDTKHLSTYWEGMSDVANRFLPLGLNPDAHNYVGESVFQLIEWVTEYKGRRWYILFEPYSGIWVRFAPNSELNSADYLPFVSSASHKDSKNFASKAFADDLYPVADSINTLFNQDLTNRQKKNLNARAYDRQMIPNVQKLDEAQHRPDALVPVNTMNGTRRVSEAFYTFETPDVAGTVDLIDWVSRKTGDQLGVSELQQGARQPASKKVGVAYTEMAQASKRLSFVSKPFVQMGQQLGARFFVSLKDYMKQPMAIQLLGEKGIEWDVLKRIDLAVRKTPEISISSQMMQNDINEAKKNAKLKAFELTAQSQNVNARVRDEYIFRDIGGFEEHDIALLMDVSAVTDKETLAEVSAAIQEIVLHGKKPKRNLNADRYFVKRLLEYAKRHFDSLPLKRYEMLIEYANEHMEIAEGNVDKEAKSDVAEMMRTGQIPMEGGEMPGTPPQPNSIPV